MIHISPETVADAYTLLLRTPPFRSWRLPPADEVEFGVTMHRDRYGDHSVYRGTNDHCIRVSSRYVKSIEELLRTVGHEMIHAYQTRRGTGPKRPGHNAEFKRLMRRMCKLHEWPVEDL